MPMKQIKIIFIVQNFNGGGAERVVSYIVNYMNCELFLPVAVVIDGNIQGYSINPSVKQYRLGLSGIIHAFFPLRKIFKKEKPDLVFSTLPFSNIFIGLLKPFLATGSVRFIARESTIPSLYNRRYKLYFLVDLLTRWSYKKYIKIICQSEDMKEDLANNYNVPISKLTIINNPLNSSSPVNPRPLLTERKPKRVVRFVSVAMLRPEKGIIRILEALRLLDIDFKYFIIGDGSERKVIETAIKKFNLHNKIRLLGFQKDPHKIMVQCDMFLQGSYFEGFPNALLEASSVGLPIVAYNCPGGTKEVLNPGISGFLVQDDNRQEYVKAIKSVLAKTLDRDVISNYVQDKFAMKRIINRYQDVFIDATIS